MSSLWFYPGKDVMCDPGKDTLCHKESPRSNRTLDGLLEQMKKTLDVKSDSTKVR